MARLDGKKKSALPLVLGIAVLAALGAGGYYFYDQNRGVDTVAVAPGEVKAMNTKPGGLGVDGNVDVDAKPAQEGASENTTTENPAPAAAANSTNSNATNSATTESNSTDSAQ